MEPLVPDALLRPIIAFYAPQKVLPFGSRARGDAGPDSDIDLLVILDDDVPPERLNWKAVHEARKNFHDPVDIVRCRGSVFEEHAEFLTRFRSELARHLLP